MAYYMRACQNFHNGFRDLLEEDAPVPLDSLWIDSTDKASAQLLGAFEQEIHQAKLSQHKENQRLSYVNLAGVHADRGDFAQAGKSFQFEIPSANFLFGKVCFAKSVLQMLSRRSEPGGCVGRPWCFRSACGGNQNGK